MRRIAPPLVVLLLAASCAPAPRDATWQEVREVTPAFLGSGPSADPSLALGERGRLALTWVSRDPGGADAWLSVSADSGLHWSAPARVNDRAGRVSSYPESRPVAAWGRDGQLVVAWAAARDSGPPGDDIAARSSADGGRTWGPVSLVNADHADPRSTYHGFTALDVMPDGRPIVAWIDGRAAAAAAGEEPARAEIYACASGDGGSTWGGNVRVAGEVCPCCRIALETAANASGGVDVAVAYRGARGDLRDPRLALSRDGGASFASDTLVSADRWKLPGCPSMGPALSLDLGGGQYAWYTGESQDDSSAASRPAPGVYLVAWRSEAGAVGAKRMLADSLSDPAQPLLARLDNGTLVGAIGKAAGAPAREVLALRLLALDGTLTPWLYLGSGVRSASIAGQGSRAAWAAWAEGPRGETRVRVARLVRR